VLYKVFKLDYFPILNFKHLINMILARFLLIS